MIWPDVMKAKYPRPETRTAIVFVALFVLAFAPSVGAAKDVAEFYAGINRSDLGGTATDFGHGLASGMESLLGGTWSAEKVAQNGFALGLGWRCGRSSTLGVQYETQYVRRGTKYEMEAYDVPEYPAVVNCDVALQLSYLELAVLAHLSPNPLASVTPVFLLGPVIGFKVSSDMKLSSGGETESAELPGVAGLAVGLLGGAGLAIRLSETKDFFLQGRYYLGLTDMLDDVAGTSRAQDLTIIVGLELDVSP